MNPLVGYRAIKDTGETLLSADLDNPIRCPECQEEVQPPTNCCGYSITHVYEKDLETIIAPWFLELAGGESASTQKS